MSEVATIQSPGARADVPSATSPADVARSFDSRSAIKLCCGLSLLLVLAAWLDIGEIALRLGEMKAQFLLTALAIFIVQYLLCCIRWIMIVERQDLPVNRFDALSIYGAGTLANIFLVTSVAGMSVRMALLVRAGVTISAALASLTAERLAATAGLALCAGAGFAFGFSEFVDGPFPGIGLPGAAILSIGLLGAIVAAAVVVCNRSMLWSFAIQVWSAFRPLDSALILAALSSVVVLTGFAAVAVLALGMGLSIDPVFFISVMPAIAVVSALPISIGGWGVREGAMVAGLLLFGVPADAGAALSIAYGALGTMVALVLGGVSALMLQPARADTGGAAGSVT